MLLGQELKFKNKLCNLKLGTFFSALPGLGASALSGRVGQLAKSYSERVVESFGIPDSQKRGYYHQSSAGSA